MRTFWQETVMESAGVTGLGIGVGVAALLLIPAVRQTVFDWGRGLGGEMKGIFGDAKKAAGIVAGIAAVGAAATAAVAAPEAAPAAAPAAAAVAAPSALAAIPALIGGVEAGNKAKEFVDHITGADQPEDEP